MTVYFRKSYQRAFGTFPLKGAELRDALGTAIQTGYRAIDTAQMYGNEAETGETLAASGVPRDELLVTTKVEPSNYAEDRFLPSVERSLRDLQLDSVDVLLLHWPPADGDIAPPLRLLAEAHARGLARSVGVSNFTAAMMRRARDIVDAPLVTNQVEFHPLLDQSVLLAAATETGIPLSSYCSVARGKVLDYPLFAEIGAPLGKTAAQVVLRWILQKGVSINTMSTRPRNIQANFDTMDFTLSSIDMDRITALNRENVRLITSDVMPGAPDWD